MTSIAELKRAIAKEKMADMKDLKALKRKQEEKRLRRELVALRQNRLLKEKKAKFESKHKKLLKVGRGAGRFSSSVLKGAVKGGKLTARFLDKVANVPQKKRR